MEKFIKLGLSKELTDVLKLTGFKVPSEIQEKTIPLVLAGRDVICGSATGSGKTLVFASSIVENLQKNGSVQALVLTPTRELAEQVADSIKKFSKHKKLNVLPVYGGVSIENQIRFLRNTDVVVGTPGRILDHLNRKTLNLGNVKFLVLDEVDRMFDMGFQKDVEMIVKECPKKRQTMLFSATISSCIDYLAQKHTKDPAEISVESYVDASKLKQVYYDVPDGLKFSLFVHLLKKEKPKLVMVFCGTRRNVDFVTNNLNNLGIRAKAIHGGMIQSKRNKVLSEFNSNNGVNVLVCTDVAARGLDIQGVSHVYNYDLPKTSDEYIHRIGRTARAGREGIAISILCSRDYENFSNVQRDEKLKITEVPLPKVERVRIIVEERNSFRRRSSGGGFNRARSGGRRIDTGRNPRGRSNRFRDDRGFGRSNEARNDRSSRGVHFQLKKAI
ncbi:MAG: DEAD/DEAH box helicase [Nanoarchaeota archaeon]|nr:DEAD/DEAH box helicase [Nanoarchaeota archaeon]